MPTYVKRHRKRKIIKWLFPSLGLGLLTTVVVWPNAVGESIQEGKISNSIFGMTYRGKQPNGQTFLLKAPSAHQEAKGLITFHEPSIETQDLQMQAAEAKLNVETSHIQCEGPVSIKHEHMHIRTQKADLHLGHLKASGAQPLSAN